VNFKNFINVLLNETGSEYFLSFLYKIFNFTKQASKLPNNIDDVLLISSDVVFE